MTEVVLHPTAAPVEGFAPGATSGRVFDVVGSGAIWADGSDATFAHINAGMPPSLNNSIAAEAPLEALSLPSGATVTGIGVRFRYKADLTDFGKAFFTVRVKNQAGNDPGTSFLGVTAFPLEALTVPDDTAVHDIDHLLTPDDYTNNGVSLTEVAGWLVDGGWVWFMDYTNPTDNTASSLWVYEASVYVIYEVTEIPRLRKVPIGPLRRVPAERWHGAGPRRSGGYN